MTQNSPEYCYDVPWSDLLAQVRSLVAGEQNHIAVLANVAAHMYWQKRQYGWHWFGFYAVDSSGCMTLGPFHGPVACTRIVAGRGVCGAAVTQGQAIYVPDVHMFTDHIACSPLSKSEYVAPIMYTTEIAWVLDADSDRIDGFSVADQQGLSDLAQFLSYHFSQISS